MLYFFAFWLIYSFFGFITETLYTSILNHSFQDRGFLTLPLIPIYGFGAMIALYLLKPFTYKPVLLFVLSIVITSSLEYVTSYVMDKVFHMRWWDYSDKKFNIKGRVCLRNSFLFGVLSLALVYFIHPKMETWVVQIDANVLSQVTTMMMVLVSFDFIHSILFSLKFSSVFRNLQSTKENYPSSRMDSLEKIESIVSELKDNINALEHRLLKKYPVLKEDLLSILEELKDNLKR